MFVDPRSHMRTTGNSGLIRPYTLHGQRTGPSVGAGPRIRMADPGTGSYCGRKVGFAVINRANQRVPHGGSVERILERRRPVFKEAVIEDHDVA